MELTPVQLRALFVLNHLAERNVPWEGGNRVLWALDTFGWVRIDPSDPACVEAVKKLFP